MVKGQVRHLTTHRVLTPLMIVQGQVRLFTIRRAITPPYYHPGFTQRQVRRLTTHRALTPLKANGHQRTGSVPTGHHLPSPYTQCYARTMRMCSHKVSAQRILNAALSIL